MSPVHLCAILIFFHIRIWWIIFRQGQHNYCKMVTIVSDIPKLHLATQMCQMRHREAIVPLIITRYVLLATTSSSSAENLLHLLAYLIQGSLSSTDLMAP